jgi:hypothetical protein
MKLATFLRLLTARVSKSTYQHYPPASTSGSFDKLRDALTADPALLLP